ncbi:MAG TPA: HEAT repeat domain-containing protein [Planctomycetaceae bacterium]|nr:HEAT repeat domain-containing protein [Planctomycetaceae bacterium]
MLWRFAAALLLALLIAGPTFSQEIKEDQSPGESDSSAESDKPIRSKAAATRSSGAADRLPGAAAGANPKVLPWLASLARGYTEARRNQRPIIVRAGAESCQFCRALAKEVAKPAAQEELKRWTLVEIDVDKSPDDARLLAVGPVPALRLLTPSGRLVAEIEGAMSADQLVAWLKEHFDAAASVPPEELTNPGPLDADAVAGLIKAFRNREAAIREAAIRRLIDDPGVAAPQIVKAFSEGSLATRLAALELLREWKAPLEGVDPWRPETLTAARLDSLADWGASSDRTAGRDAPNALSEQELAALGETIDRMTTGPATDVPAIRERLARYGRLLLPEVYERLKTAATDESRERLTALRYRLVESESLAINWPEGVERLAAPDVELRHRAADELAARATASDEGLLLELFSDPAPLVREISLRALMQTGGSNVNSSLLRLLEDPEPNVRAAVLKQLQESPSAALVPRVAAYASNEKDPDLVVHAIRVLRESAGKATGHALTRLLEHESWQVRAEAAEGLGKSVDRTSTLSESEKADVYVAMIELLKDPDGFVVSRAVNVLSQADLAAAVDPLADAVARHPELAVEIVKALAHGQKKRLRAGVHLREFAAHADPKIRAAAIAGLCSLNSESLKDELRKALNDEAREVRIAAANAFFGLLEARRHSEDAAIIGGQYVRRRDVSEPGHANAAEVDEPASTEAPETADGQHESDDDSPPPSDDQPADHSDESTQDAPDPVPELAEEDGAPAPAAASKEQAAESFALRDCSEGWLLAIREGKIFVKWQRELRSALEPMLRADDPQERAAALLPLAALGADELALPEAARIIDSLPRMIPSLSKALPWLLAADRERVLERMLKRSESADDFREIADNLAQTRSPQAGAGLWNLFSQPRADATTAEALKSRLLQFYFPRHIYQLNQAPSRDKKLAIAAAKLHATTGKHWQRMAALSLLMSLDSPAAAQIAREMADDESAPLENRVDAMQVALAALSQKEVVRYAVRQLSSPHAEFHGKALAALAGDSDAVRSLRDGIFHLDANDSHAVFGVNVGAATGQPIVPEAPRGLSTEPLRPLLESDDARVAAQAGYLLALLGDSEGLVPLMGYWRARAPNDTAWMRLVYRAIARLDDASQIPSLKEIYSRLSDDQHRHLLSEFYWTIRNMTGAEILALRKTMRTEVGVQNLR